MSELEKLKARVSRMETELSNQRRTMIKEFRKMIDFHTHTLGGKVVWEFPPHVVKEGLKRMTNAAKNTEKPSVANERVPVSDNFEFDMKKVSE